MHWHVIQIIKHNGDNDAFSKPSLPSWHDCSELNTASQPSNNFPPPSHSSDEPHLIFFLRKSTYWVAGVSHFISPSRLAQQKNYFYFQWISAYESSSKSYYMSWYRAPPLTEIQGKRVWCFLCLLFPDLSQRRGIIHSYGADGDDVRLTFSLCCSVVADPTRRNCQRQTSAVFSLSCSSVQHTQAALEVNRAARISAPFSHLQTFKQMQHMWARWQSTSHPILKGLRPFPLWF